jgi:hypothetical protein
VGSAAEPAPICDKKERLHRAYWMATADYERAFNYTAWTHVSGKEYDRLRQYIEEARLRSEEARQALDRHIAEHGC